MKRITTVVFLAAFGLGCQQTNPIEPTGVAAGGSSAAGNGIVMSATGNGTYDAGVIVTFSMNALAKADGSAKGEFRHTTTLGGELIDFTGRVTCMAVDSANGRSWIGGVITENNSTHSSFTGAINQVGRDVWFRVLDSGEGNGVIDRTTFLGFEGGGGIDTSAEYCEMKIWPNDPPNDRTGPLTSGNIQVRP
ncbi:MAG TPA: hypothetical protein VMM93_03530 [Vicinamibacterales bacterium]|nr:hypothetical protein [Vicinamibacterales bacterium]